MKKKTQDEYVEEVRLKRPDVMVLGQYNGAKNTIRHRCSCGNDQWFAEPRVIFRGGCCMECNSTKRKTHSEYIEILKNARPDIQVLEKYNGTDKKIQHKCSCGNENWYIEPYVVLRGTLCSICGDKVKSHEQYVKEVLEINPNIQVLEKYVNCHTKIRHKCFCGNENWIARPSGVLRGDSCHGAKKSYEEFMKEFNNAVQNEYSVISDYTNYSTKVTIKHNSEACGNFEWDIAPIRFMGVKNRKGSRCPKCSGIMKFTHAEFIEKIFQLVQEEYTVVEQYVKSNTKIKFRHNSTECDNFEWYVQPHSFLGSSGKLGSRCPKCSKRLKKDTDMFKREVFDKFGDEYTVLGEYVRIKDKILIRHNDNSCDNHEFMVVASNFLGSNNKSGSKCPKCFGHTLKTNDEFLQMLYKQRGNEYMALEPYVNSQTKILMRHNSIDCNFHEWYVKPNSILNNANRLGSGCPICNESKGERCIRQYLEKSSITYTPYMKFDDLLGIGGKKLSYDFYLPELSLLIEYQGEFHDGNGDKGGGYIKTNLDRQKEHDARKKKYVESHNKYRLLEIWYWDFDNIEQILENKLNELKLKSAI